MLVEVKARLVSARLADRLVASSLQEWNVFGVWSRGLEKSCGKRRGLPLRGSAVVKLTAKVREVLETCKHQEALCRVKVAMRRARDLGKWMLSRNGKAGYTLSWHAPSLLGMGGESKYIVADRFIWSAFECQLQKMKCGLQSID